MTTDRQRARWDAISGWFATNAGGVEQDDLCLTTIDELHLLDAGGTVLDIGCGTGRHLARLSSQSGGGIGLDLSEKMIERARELAASNTAPDCEFLVHDWTRGAPEPIRGRMFDLVIANNTPAVSGPADLDRMLEHARGHVVLAKPIHRSSALLDEILRPAGRHQRTAAGSRALGGLLGRLFELGYRPLLRYRTEHWRPRLEREPFLAWVAEHETPGDPSFLDRAAQVFEARSADGVVEDSISARLALAVWDMRTPSPSLP